MLAIAIPRAVVKPDVDKRKQIGSQPGFEGNPSLEHEERQNSVVVAGDEVERHRAENVEPSFQAREVHETSKTMASMAKRSASLPP